MKSFSLKLLLLLAILVPSSTLFRIHAQDLVVTAKGDSINCKITQISDHYIHIMYSYGKEVRKTLFSREEIITYKKRFYAVPEIPADRLRKFRGDYPHFIVGIHGGWSYLFAPINPQLPSFVRHYKEELNWGHHIGADAGYFISENMGYGLMYSYFFTSNRIDDITVIDNNGNTHTGSMSDDISIHYIGPALFSSFPFNKKQMHFNAGLSCGYMSYTNKARLIDPYQLKSGTLGASAKLEVDIMLTKSMALSLGASGVLGALDYFNYSDNSGSKTIQLAKYERETISRVEFYLGLKWGK